MKKMVLTAAAGMFVFSAATAFAADAIDAGARARVAINAPAAATVKAAAPQVVLDSTGVLTAAVPAAVSPASASNRTGRAKDVCLDSSCKTTFKM